jgi:hypothetical protein
MRVGPALRTRANPVAVLAAIATAAVNTAISFMAALSELSAKSGAAQLCEL